MTSYKCSNCDFTRSIKGYVTQHISKTVKCTGSTIIENIVKVQCEVCNKEFNNDSLLSTHRKKCVEKKALITQVYADPSEIKELLKVFTDMLRKYEDENKDLIRRVEKLEKAQIDSKKGYTEVNGNYECEFLKPLYYIPKDFDTVLSNTFEGGRCPARFTIQQVNIIGKEGVFVGSVIPDGIKVEGDLYLFKKKKGSKHVGDLQVCTGEEKCENKAKYMTCDGEEGLYYCDDHIH